MTSRRWGLVVSLSGELVVLGVLLVIPLAWPNQLTHLDWRTTSLSAPPPLSKPAPNLKRQAAARPTEHRLVAFWPRLTSNPREPANAPEFDAPGSLVGVAGSLESNPAGNAAPILQSARIAPPPDKPNVAEPRPPPKLVNVSKGAQLAKLIHQPKPIYPPFAITARISGTVQLVGIISRDGTIRNLQVISGNPLLIQAALEAVRQWVYRPTLLNGEPVEVTSPIEVNFILNR
jgi:periplasmic protein TonB